MIPQKHSQIRLVSILTMSAGKTVEYDFRYLDFGNLINEISFISDD